MKRGNEMIDPKREYYTDKNGYRQCSQPTEKRLDDINDEQHEFEKTHGLDESDDDE